MNYLTRSSFYGLCPLVKLLLGFSWIKKGGLFLNAAVVYGTLVFGTESVDGKQRKYFYVVSYSDTLIVNFFVKNKDWGRGRGGLIERGGLLTFLL